MHQRRRKQELLYLGQAASQALALAHPEGHVALGHHEPARGGVEEAGGVEPGRVGEELGVAQNRPLKLQIKVYQ